MMQGIPIITQDDGSRAAVVRPSQIQDLVGQHVGSGTYRFRVDSARA